MSLQLHKENTMQLKMVFRIETGEMIAYGTGGMSQWEDNPDYYVHTPTGKVHPSGYEYTYDGTNVIKGSEFPEHDLTTS